jgi:hypothetical protein
MKRITLFLAFIGMMALQSCTVNDNPPVVDNDTISEVFEIKGVDFGYNSVDGFNIYQKLTPKILTSDVVLIYRLSGTIDSSTPIWQLIPRTIYLTNGREIDYDFDFSREDFKIFAKGNYDLETTPSFIDNQTFRIVIVPGSFSKSIDKNNFDAVISALKVNENQIHKINF